MSPAKDSAVHPLILVCKTGFHDVKKLTECRKIDTIHVVASAEGQPDERFTYHYYTHDYLIPN